MLAPGEIGERLSLGLWCPVREALKERVAEGSEQRGHILLAPGTKQNNAICQRRDPKLRHTDNVWGSRDRWPHTAPGRQNQQCRHQAQGAVARRAAHARPPPAGAAYRSHNMVVDSV